MAYFAVLFVKLNFVAFCLLTNISKCFSSEWEHVQQHKIPGFVPSFDSQLLHRGSHAQDRRQAASSPLEMESCQFQNATLLKSRFDSNVFTKVFNNDSLTNFTVLWIGDDDAAVMVVSMGNSTIPSTLYLSQNYGKTFDNLTESLNNFAITSVQQCPTDRKMVIFVAYSERSTTLFLSSSGSNITKVTLPFNLTGPIRYHPSNQKMLLALGNDRTQMWKAWQSTNGGLNWELIHNYVNDIQWSEDPNQKTTFYFTNASEIAFEDVSRKEYDLMKAVSSNLTLIAHKVRTFKIAGKFLYALAFEDQKRKKSILRVSTNGGLRWNAVQLPVTEEDQFYKILDISDGMVSIHVDGLDQGFGTLFTSDADGIVFSDSLHRHVYPKVQDVNDFYKVKSMRGVFFASQLGADNKKHTMITYNRGAKWSPLCMPSNCSCAFKDSMKCSLHIASLVETTIHVPMGPLSVRSAVGIILAHGYVGYPTIPISLDVFVSSDGGYNWAKVLSGPHLYAIADHGGLLVAVPVGDQPSNHIKFSLDEGETWSCYQFTSDRIKVTGLLTDPESLSLKVGIWGYGLNDSVWRVTVIDFQPIIERPCKEPNDFTDFTAHKMSANDGSQKGCLLGVKETFRKVKKGSRCYLGQAHTVLRSTEHCKCTQDDFECDFGFYRSSNDKPCLENPRYKGAELDICLDGEEKKIVTYGYRKIPGDVCNGGYDPGARYEKNIKIKCDEGDKILLGSLKVGSNGSATGLFILVILIIIMTGLIFGMSVFFIRKFQQINTSPLTYRYSRLSQEDAQEDETMCIMTNNLGATLASSEEDDEPATLLVDTSDIMDSFNIASNGTANRNQAKKYFEESDEELLQ